MSTVITTEFDAREVQDAIRKLPKAFRAEVKKEALPAIGLLLSAESSSRAPIRTGFLAIDTAFHRVEGDSAVIVGHNAAYAAAVHQRHKVQPRFLARAISETARGIILGAIKGAHAQAVAKSRGTKA